MQMAAPVLTNEFVGHGTKLKSKPRPFKTERVGHPEKLNQSLGVDVLEWYHLIVSVRQQKRGERVGHPPWVSEVDGVRGYGGSVEVLKLGLRSGNTGVRSLGFVQRAWFADVGRCSPGLVRRRLWSARWPWFGDSNPSINTHGAGTYNTADIAFLLDHGGVASAHGGKSRRETSICARL
jgi:hypothetical protein